MLRDNMDEPTAPVMQCELEQKQSVEGNYSRTVSQVEPQVVRGTILMIKLRKMDVSIKNSWLLYHQVFLVPTPPSLSTNVRGPS